MFSFFTGPERLGVALSELVLLAFCFAACVHSESQISFKCQGSSEAQKLFL